MAFDEVSPRAFPPRNLVALKPKSLLVPLIVAGCFVVGAAVAFPGAVGAVLVATLSLFVIAIGFLRPQALLTGILLIWLPLLALFRRLAHFSVASSVDLLLLVAPLATIVLILVIRRSGPLSRLAKAVLALNVLTALSAFNPLQAGSVRGPGDLVTSAPSVLTVGFSGLLFLLIPVLWFWIGRGLLSDDIFRRLVRILPIAAVAAAFYGLFQALVGFPFFDQTWIAEKGYAALNVGGTIRAFGTFASSSEYGAFLGIGLVVLLATTRHLQRPLIVAAALLLATAIFLISSRSIVVLTVFAMAGVFSARSRIGPLKFLPVAATGLVLLWFGLGQLGSQGFGGERAGKLVEHQVTGLTQPLNEETSTLPIHLELFANGIREGFTNPLGLGPGAVTLAGQRFEGKTLNTEVDFSNAAVALGIPGFVLFSFIAVSGLLLAYRAARKDPAPLKLAALGILLVTSLQWLNGGQYAVAPLPWLVLGWLEAQSRTGAAAE